MSRVSLLEERGITKDGKAMILAYDHGMEHGPRDFDPAVNSEDTAPIIDIAAYGGFTGLVLLPGDAETYHKQLASLAADGVQTPALILKVNCKSELFFADDPYSPLLFFSARHAVSAAKLMKAAALGYTLYLGSKYEHLMVRELVELVFEAHLASLPVICWVYPRSNEWVNSMRQIEEFFYTLPKTKKDRTRDEVKALMDRKGIIPSESALRAIVEARIRKCAFDETPTIIAYAASAGAKLGADMVKIKYPAQASDDDLHWISRVAGQTKVVLSGGSKSEKFLDCVQAVMRNHWDGIAVGRNIWQNPYKDALEASRKLRELIYGNEEPRIKKGARK